MAVGSTQPLTGMSNRSISWGKGGRYVRLTTLSSSCAVVMKSGNLNFLEPSGSLQPSNGTYLPFIHRATENELTVTDDNESQKEDSQRPHCDPRQSSET